MADKHCGLLLCVVVCYAATCGCNKYQSAPIKANPAEAAGEAIKLYDKNNDAELDASELQQTPSLEGAIDRLDSNGDGKVSQAEIEARIKGYEGLSTHIACEISVKQNRQPVADAKVTIAPEPFMGTAFPTYQGQTNSSGTANVTSDPPSPGIAVGFYRITIETPDGQKHERGIEVADDMPTANRIEVAL